MSAVNDYDPNWPNLLTIKEMRTPIQSFGCDGPRQDDDPICDPYTEGGDLVQTIDGTIEKNLAGKIWNLKGRRILSVGTTTGFSSGTNKLILISHDNEIRV